jgi:uncharacterized membrane protein
MSRTWSIVLGVVLVASVAMSFVGPSKEAEHIWDVKAFFAVYGFVGCVVIIYVSKAVGKYWLQRPDAYYEPYRAPAEVGEAGRDTPEAKEADHA